MRLRRRNLVGREPEPGRGLVDQALDDIVRFGDARTAVGVGEDGVGEHPFDFGMDRGRAVGVGQHARIEQGGRDRSEIGDIGAEIGEGPHAQAEEPPVRVQRQRRPGEVVAGLGVAHESLGTSAQPAHRAGQPARGPGHQDLLGIGEILHAEAAAQIVGKDP